MSKKVDAAKKVERLYYLIDIFPEQIPKESKEFFLEAEHYFLKGKEMEVLKDKFIRIILKTVCYFKFKIYTGQWYQTVSAKKLKKLICKVMEKKNGFVDILLVGEGSLICMEKGCLYMTVYYPSKKVHNIISQLAKSEGLFWRKGENG